MKPNVEDLVRCDRVGLYDRYGAWRYFPMQGPTYGDLWLTCDGRIGYSRVSWMSGESWDMPLSDVENVSRVGANIYPWCAQLWPSTSFEADFSGKRRLVFFTGITVFMSKTDKLVSKIPGVHHAGAAVVAAKSAIQNRGSKARGKAVLEAWLKVLDGSVAARDYPHLIQTDPCSE
jgi:hypothetical protein